MCRTSLKREAALCDYTTDDNTKRFEKGLSNLVYANSVAYLNFVRRTIHNLENIRFADDRERTFGVMLYYTLFLDKIDRVGVNSIEEGISRFPSR